MVAGTSAHRLRLVVSAEPIAESVAETVEAIPEVATVAPATVSVSIVIVIVVIVAVAAVSGARATAGTSTAIAAGSGHGGYRGHDA
jgi:hypothetical protein